MKPSLVNADEGFSVAPMFTSKHLAGIFLYWLIEMHESVAWSEMYVLALVYTMDDERMMVVV